VLDNIRPSFFIGAILYYFVYFEFNSKLRSISDKMKQLTLTGTRKRNVIDFVKGSDAYSNVINVLWRLEFVGSDRKAFQNKAQQIWKTQYKGKPDKIEKLLSDDSDTNDYVGVNSPFVKPMTVKLDNLHLDEPAAGARANDADSSTCSRYNKIVVLCPFLFLISPGSDHRQLACLGVIEGVFYK
jgi:hypothetical protein